MKQSYARTLATITLLLFLMLAAHLPVIKKTLADLRQQIGSEPFDQKKRLLGDQTYYLLGTLSLLDFDIDKKFQTVGYPNTQTSHPIQTNDLPWFAKYLLVAYPYPSIRVGLSVTAAALTKIIPETFFAATIPRLRFANLLLNLFSLTLIFLLSYRITQSRMAAIVPALFFIFDVSNTYNSYETVGHTACGIFYLFLATFFFISLPSVSPIHLGGICFFLACAVLSSPHVISLSFSLALGAVYFTVSRPTTYRRIWYVITAIVGAGSIPGYLFCLESVLQFKKVGIPTWLEIQQAYLFPTGLVMQDLPLSSRAIWDLTLFNAFLYPILILSFALFIYHRFVSTRNLWQTKLFCSQSKETILLGSLILGSLLASFQLLPISRAMTPYTVSWGLALGIFLGKFLSIGSRVEKTVVSVVSFILLLLFLNFTLMLNLVPFRDKSPQGNVFVIDETENFDKSSKSYFTKLRTRGIQPNGFEQTQFNFRFISKSVNAFFQEWDPHQELNIDYIKFDPMLLVEPYVRTSQFLPSWNPHPSYAVTSATYQRDFKFLMESFERFNRGDLGAEGIIRIPKQIWKFSTWDQEIFYAIGYTGEVKRYLKGTPLENIDTHSNYYIDYKALRKIARYGRPSSQ